MVLLLGVSSSFSSSFGGAQKIEEELRFALSSFSFSLSLSLLCLRVFFCRRFRGEESSSKEKGRRKGGKSQLDFQRNLFSPFLFPFFSTLGRFSLFRGGLDVCETFARRGGKEEGEEEEELFVSPGNKVI